MGVEYSVFWTLNPKKLKPFEKAYSMKLEAKQNRMNLDNWLQGLYNQHAIASVLSKRAKYPQKPFDLFGTSKKTPQQEADEFMRFMLQHNAQKRVSEEVRDK